MKLKKKFYKDIWFWLGLLLVVLGIQKILNFSNNTLLLTLFAVLQVAIGGGLVVQTARKA